MYKLVIVEDELDVRRRIAALIEKAESGFETIAEYETGIDAYDGIISECPDLILTDIKIPYISGIELAKRVREVLPLVKIIIITGYNEFDFAKEAANLGVVGFVSKPVTLEDIREHLQKAELILDEEYLTAANLSRFESFYDSYLPIIKENDLFLLSKCTDISSISHKLERTGINLNYRYYVNCLFDFDVNQESNDFAFSTVRKYVEEEFTGKFNYEIFNHYEKLCLLIKSDNTPDMKELETALDRIIQRIGRYSGMPLSVGMSNAHETPRNFAAMVKEAKRALEYRRVIGGRKVFFFGNSNPLISGNSVDDNLIKEIGYALHFQSISQCLSAIDEIQTALENSKDSHNYVTSSILNVLVKSCDDPDGLYSRYGGPDNLYRRFFEIKTDDEVFAFLKELVYVIRELNDGVIVGNVERSLKKITSYMDTHFCDPNISFESLAREVNFSISYISALLKKNLNTSFVKLLTGMRMEKAKELLADPSLKIIDVAEQLGYSDSYYFSHCFKKYLGLSPKEYRSHENIK